MLNRALASFQAGHVADAIVDAESLCRRHPRSIEPAILRAHVLQAVAPALALAAWFQAWKRRPENALLQDALLRAWLADGQHKRVRDLAPLMLPERCRAGSEAALVELFFQSGGSRMGACWREGESIACRVYAADAQARPTLALTLDDGVRTFAFDMPGDGTPFFIVPPHDAPVWSLAIGTEAGRRPRVLQGSPLVFGAPRRAAPPPVPHAAAAVDVIIPVYLDGDLTRRCIDSVIASLGANRTPATITVIDDAGPDAALADWLDALARDGSITLLRNRLNLGFIETVNRGLAAHPDHDALLLNADTMVHGDWIDRMRASLYQEPGIASVSAWSNNGEISSFPEVAAAAPMPSMAELQALDGAAAALHAQGGLQDVDLPVCCGFALLMRRAALDVVGVLDGQTLRRGYGEEVDWCLRAAAAGYRHRLSAGVFIAHAGGASFGAEKALRVAQNDQVIGVRYPDFQHRYDAFVRTDPLAAQRRTLADGCVQVAASEWLRRARQVQAQALPALGLPIPVPAGCARVAVWDHRPGGTAAGAVLALARMIASERTPLRLLVFGEAGDALLHTGVVDAMPFSFAGLTGGLTNAEVLGLAGCEDVLAVPGRLPQGLPAAVRATRLDADFAPAAWLARRSAGVPARNRNMQKDEKDDERKQG